MHVTIKPENGVTIECSDLELDMIDALLDAVKNEHDDIAHGLVSFAVKLPCNFGSLTVLRVEPGAVTPSSVVIETTLGEVARYLRDQRVG